MIGLAEEDEMLKRLRGQFDGYFTSYGLGARKPHPDIFRKLLAKINLKPHECIFIDDDELPHRLIEVSLSIKKLLDSAAERLSQNVKSE